jgi:hypothetical protein
MDSVKLGRAASLVLGRGVAASPFLSGMPGLRVHCSLVEASGVVDLGDVVLEVV